MTPQQFVSKWRQVNLSERSTAQLHFIDLCDLLNVARPLDDDPDGASYTFERGAHKVGGGEGWADVWKRGCFGWEYKRKRKDLKAAYNQLLQYREDLENPPLLVVCDMDRFEIHTNFTGTAKQVYRFDLENMAEPENLTVLHRVFTAPGELRPHKTKDSVTKAAANSFGELAKGLRKRGVPAKDAAHFLMKLMFCMFAEDIELLPNNVFKRCLEAAYMAPSRFRELMTGLFHAMAHGGTFGADYILHFNGGLFSDANVIELNIEEIAVIRRVAEEDWSAVEPSIFGTLFERSFDPDKEELVGAHYTSREDIETLLRPVMLAPLRREWDKAKRECEALWPEIQALARKQSKITAKQKASKPRAKFDRLIHDFVEQLSHVKVLDPACGSGNFLYVALHLLLALEKEVITYAASHGVSQLPHVRPTQLLGIEINPYAQELAQVVIWIGYLQWMRDNGFSPPRNPVLEPIESIRRMDAILDLTNPAAPLEPEWPTADFIVGNPPFLGGKLLRRGLGDEYVDTLFRTYDGRLRRNSDLCCYWFEKARHQLERTQTKRVGLLATQAIRGGDNRVVLDRVRSTGEIFFGVSDRDWILDGAAVHVSLIGFDDGSESERSLDGNLVAEITSSLATSADMSTAKKLAANLGVGFQGVTPMGPFEISASNAMRMMQASGNPNGRPNSDVVRRWANGKDLLEGKTNEWVIDFGVGLPEGDAAKYELPFEYTRTDVKPAREKGETKEAIPIFWKHWRARPDMREAINRLRGIRFLVTPRVSKHRIFLWVSKDWLPSDATIAFAVDDDFHFGVLHSRVHEVWARAPGSGTQLRERESGFRYTPTTCFETFPFPEPTKAQRAAIAAAAKELDELRNNWLNPPEWTQTETLEFPGSTIGPWARYVRNADSRGIGTVRYPRLVPRDVVCAGWLKKQTLTNLYNKRPTWLDLAHRKLDEAVFAAYGWSPSLSDDELLAALLRLNLERAE